MPLSLSSPCPCGSGRTDAACCAPILRGEPAPTAEALMRSRYTAHVRADEEHLLRSWDPRTRPLRAGIAGVERWLGLTVLDVAGGMPDEDEGEVLFEAGYLDGDGIVRELAARSRFRRHRGRWVYVDDADQ